MQSSFFRRLALACLFAVAAQAHVGSPDVYVDGKAGPYQLFVTIRPPQVIPGVASLEIRSENSGLRDLTAVPIPIAGPGAKYAPIPDKLNQSKQDAQFFTGSLWIMAPGSWQVRISATGDKGAGALSVPVPSAASTTKTMQLGIGALLSVLGLFLLTGMVAIVGASSREAKLPAGVIPTTQAKYKGRIAMTVAAVVLLGIVFGGNLWWKSEAAHYGDTVYRPIEMTPTLDGNGTLMLRLADSGWLQMPKSGPVPHRMALFLFRHSIDDLVPDHDHLMHLYALRQPGLDAVYHLHPDQVEAGLFRLQLPAILPGRYRLYADIVHANGFPETPVADIKVPDNLPSRPLAGDDASAMAGDWLHSKPATSFTLPDGYRMEWVHGNEPLVARQGQSFRFRLIDQKGRPPQDMALYMGMLGHAAFVKTDGTVFAHIHPMGTASMTALNLTQSSTTQKQAMDTPGTDMSSMPGMNMPAATAKLPNDVSFPYGFPKPGKYRIFVQMKHGNTVETGVFDAVVS
jgi:hypothetical protein